MVPVPASDDFWVDHAMVGVNDLFSELPLVASHESD